LGSIGDAEVLEKSGSVMSANDIVRAVYYILELKNLWGKGIGSVSSPFHLLFWGAKGSGKSTLLINFAKYLAKEHKLKVLYVAKEEGTSYTLQEKIKRLKANVNNLYFTADLPKDSVLKQFDVLLIDSVNSLNMTSSELEALKTKNPNLSTVCLLMAYKSGDTYKGDSDFGHNAQAVFKVYEGKWKAEKNRFGGSDEVDIQF
jgi:predicted ATP-dependent serine protease